MVQYLSTKSKAESIGIDLEFYIYRMHHRISIQPEGKRGGGGLFFTRIEPNWPLPYLRDAGPAGWVNCFSICASTMPRAQNRAAEGSILCIVKTKYNWRSGYSLSMGCTKEYILVRERTAPPWVFQTFAHPTSPPAYSVRQSGSWSILQTEPGEGRVGKCLEDAGGCCPFSY